MCVTCIHMYTIDVNINNQVITCFALPKPCSPLILTITLGDSSHILVIL